MVPAGCAWDRALGLAFVYSVPKTPTPADLNVPVELCDWVCHAGLDRAKGVASPAFRAWMRYQMKEEQSSTFFHTLRQQ